MPTPAEFSKRTVRQRITHPDHVLTDGSPLRLPRAEADWESPEAAAHAREPARLPLEVIDELSPAFREVVRSRDVDDRPPRRFARRLHVSTRNVAVRLHRAHKLLRPRLLRRLADAEAGRSSKKKPVIAPLPKLSFRESPDSSRQSGFGTCRGRGNEMRTGSTSRLGGGWAIRLLSGLLFVVPMTQGRFVLLSSIALSVFLTVFLAGGIARAKDVERFIKVTDGDGAPVTDRVV